MHKIPQLKIYTMIGAIIFCLSLSFSAQTAGTNQASGLSDKEILEAVDRYRIVDESFAMTIDVLSYEDNILKDSVSLNGRALVPSKSLIIFTEPKQMRGRKILKANGNMWMYFPRTSRPVRIMPSQRLLGNVTTGDIASMHFSSQYTIEKVLKESWKGKTCKRLVLTAKKRGQSYNMIHLWVDAEDLRPLHASYFTLSGKLLKTADFTDYQKTHGLERPKKMVIYDATTSGKFSEIIYQQLSPKENPSRIFTKSYLKRL